VIPRLDDGLPPGAPAQVGLEGPIDRTVLGGVGGLLAQRGQADDDAGSAEAALASARVAQRVGPTLGDGRLQTVDGGDGAARHPPHRGDAGDTRRAVDQDRAAPALSLRAAAVLGTLEAEAIAENLEQGGAVVGNLVDGTVDGQLKGGPTRRGRPVRPVAGPVYRQLNDEPQPQVRWALGLSIEKPAWLRPSL